jgi:hypothetical protein
VGPRGIGCLHHEHIHHCGLEAGRQVSDRQSRGIVPQLAHLAQHGGFQPAETEVEAVFRLDGVVRQPAREGERGRDAPFRGFLARGAAGL